MRPAQTTALSPLMFRSLFLCLCTCLSLTAAAEVLTESQLNWTTPPGGIESSLHLAPSSGLAKELPLTIQDEAPPLPTIDLTTEPDDLWQRVRNGFSMPNLASPLVADRQAWYLNRPEMLKQVLDRSRRYLYYIVGELEKRGMPTELALLPIVESSYNPMAYSRARASGIWQFIPSTGRSYRLEQNWWLDQRRDVIASTGAALDYLQTIYEMHGDWHLALASYNWGEHAVARAVAKNQARNLPTDYANLTMPVETRYYVPKLQALKNIIAQPKLFGISINPIPNRPYFDMVGKPANMDLSIAAKLAEMPLDEFIALNPAYNRPVMPAGKDSPLVLPTGKVQTFLANLQHHENQEKPLSNWHTYRLKKGEKIETVAARHRLSAAYLKQINGITRRTRLPAGTTLLVPRKDGQASANLQEVNLPPNEPELPKTKPQKSAGKATGKGSKKTVAKSGKPKPPVKSTRTAKKKPAKKR
ncbi:MAG: transglycosylase SLT domain-containing protein [Betaproteobacteria bacterium]|nr:transglycosylase SLT domain-containing protein [Betaproteobacteria bacterium]